MEVDEGKLSAFTERVLPLLDERQRRLVLGALAEMAGLGGSAVVARAAGVARSTVASGVREVLAGVGPSGRVRRPGAGRPVVIERNASTLAALEGATVEHRGACLEWSVRSVREVADRLASAGVSASPSLVGQLLREEGYVLRTAPGRSGEGVLARRRAGFAGLAERLDASLAAGGVVVSARCEERPVLIGSREWLRERRPDTDGGRYSMRDFADPDPAASIPYGTFDIGVGDGWEPARRLVARRVANAVTQWWDELGHRRSAGAPSVTVVLMTAASSDSRGLAGLLTDWAEGEGVSLTVEVLPAGITRWRAVDHRFFAVSAPNERGAEMRASRVALESIVRLPVVFVDE